MRLTFLCLPAALLCALPLAAQTPHSGTDVLNLMHKKYENRWYRTLLFNQKTTMYRGDSATVATWHETLQYVPGSGAKLRIDQGDPAAGNGTLYTWDSTWSIKGGQVTHTAGSGNQFLGLIENVYLQPVAETVHQLEPLNFDMTKVYEGRWQGRPVWVVGAASAADSTSPQFWIDKDRLAVVRMILILAPGRPPFDIQLGNLVATGGGWLATKVSMYSGGKPRQIEEYYDWNTTMPIDTGLFAPATWNSAKHWFH